ncbi:putative DsRNA-binding domain-like superfamily protein [Hibiscus syriacus]|uniref:DsRNA-binding domain-like superfamily protein n=1 Tax=Hibiscus syriacus TaxID=106335 RepID=A0A6A3CBZ9_HIBSY|nr:pentatricopeptide repeat-containing protein At1g77360, mitochondrial-like [Hibiscus syriacus]KAE8726713.1 putative DsRNA-binding domain-like superfamily protein [Hibiscus syriacus]
MAKDRKRSHSQRSPSPPKPSIFPSYQTAPNLNPKVKLLCEIISTTPSASVESLLEDTGLRITQHDVENVLSLSYSFPSQAVKFFRWSGHELQHQHSPYSWNLVVDLLGKNGLFDAMWDAIKSMKNVGLVSLATFASVFSSYVRFDKVKEAVLTFEVMDEYGCVRDVVALNTLISAICREGKTIDGLEFLRVAKSRIKPDLDSYAMLLEGWENEGNASLAKTTFDEMIAEVGWDPGNVPAYDSFLNALIKGKDGISEALRHVDILLEKKCYPGMKFFRDALEDFQKVGNVRGAELIWKTMVEKVGILPDTEMYNSMITLYCSKNYTDMAKKMLDEMVFTGAFPDAQSYDVLFHFLIKNRKLKDASMLFNEMVKNEFFPSKADCVAAVKIFLDIGDPYVAIKVWKFMIENYDSDLEQTGNILINGLRDANMLPEAVKYAEGMIEKRIKVTSATLSRLKHSLSKEKKDGVYEELLRKWKSF